MWRAIGDDGEVVEILVQRRRNLVAAGKLIRALLEKQSFAPSVITTDTLRSYRAAFSDLGLSARHEQGLGKNNLAEVSHQPNRSRERKTHRFKSRESAELFLPMHSAVYNTFNSQRHLISRRTHRKHRAEATNHWRSAVGAHDKSLLVGTRCYRGPFP